MQGVAMYEWLPAGIVLATLVTGLVSESLEAGRFQRFRAVVRSD